MSQRRPQPEGAAAAEGGGSQGPTSADGEVRIGLNDLILGNGPGAPQYGRVFHRQRRSASIPNTLEYERAMELSNKASLSRALCCRLLSCCESPSVRACRGLILMGLNYRKTLYSRRLRSTQNVGPTILSNHLLRRLRCTVG